MSTTRKVAEVLMGKPVLEGAGVKLMRGFSYPEAERFDPFLLFDDFSSEHREDHSAGFPWHPHRGMETVTYILNGTVRHHDSLKNEGVLRAGDVQWMTAGSGIIHEEMPGDEEQLVGFQLWVNLPMKDKMTHPRYQEVPALTIPIAVLKGAHIKVIAGDIAGVHGPVEDIFAKPQYLDVTLDAGAKLEFPIPEGHTAFVYVIDGNITAGGGEDSYEPHTIVRFERAGDTVATRAGKAGARFLLIAGKPFHEPIAWHGPIVMNTEEELRTAFHELQDGTFIRHTI